jgi:hypothetical protein
VSRSRELAVGPTWADQVALRREAAELVEASDEVVEARAKALQVDLRRLRAFINEARRRRT